MKLVITFLCMAIFLTLSCSMYYFESLFCLGPSSTLLFVDNNLENTFTIENDFGHKEIRQFTKELKHHSPPDPAMYMNASQLIQYNGFPCEVHYVETSDGYILGMQRIPQPSRDRLPVLLMHGLLSSSDCFLTNLVNESLAYILYNEGYDVWLGNVRGNAYSTDHVRLSPNEREFWKFSFDEMGKYDTPAMVDYVLNQTKSTKLNYIGHSQGTTTLIAAATSEGHKFAVKINKFIALAPAAILRHMTSILRYLTYASYDIGFIFNLFNDGEFLPRQGLINKISEFVCPKDPKLCENVLFLLAGSSDLSNTNRSRLPVYLAHTPAGTSVRNMLHWSQMSKIDGMQHYDYGSNVTNRLHYGSVYPPAYNLSTFNIETYAFCGGKDSVVVPQDCHHLLSVIQNVKKRYFIPSYNHLDFVWAVNAKPMIYDNVIQALRGSD